MPAIVPTSMQGSGMRTLTETTLNGSDTFTYQAGDVLILRNPTGGTITPTLDGAGGTTVPVDGLGDITVSSGLALAGIPAGAARVIPLDTIRFYLQGVTSILTGTGLVASIQRY